MNKFHKSIKIYPEYESPLIHEYPLKRFKKAFQFERWEDQDIPNKTRALVLDSDGDVSIGVMINGTWIDEGSICYAGGGDVVDDVEYYSILN